ncbi:GAF and ANTAR domain-containing protein [Streptomyces sp. NPDC059786]|uniref:GAF and ANTAR domain-containing protein n=1 Tax=Streptomyces sp. NPDC059786 TaxID=3346946 RepID=UPI00364DFF77
MTDDVAGSAATGAPGAGGTRHGDGDGEAEPDAVEARNRRLAHAGVARAERLLLARYRLGSQREAFELLRTASQRRNIKLHTLADAVVNLPAPERTARTWFASRPRSAAPSLSGLDLGQDAEPASHGAVLKAALRRVLHITEAGMGNVQLAENGMLRMEKHTGLNRPFTDYFAFVQDSTTSCAQAAEQRRQVTIKDVAVSDVFDDVSRAVILQADSRACHSVPLTSPRGAVLGMISSHHERPLAEFADAQLGALQQLGAQVGRWLLWHRSTVVLDALEDVHTAATVRR